MDKKRTSQAKEVSFKPIEIIKNALSHLSERDADVIVRRHGLKTGEKETLEEIGKTYQLTRERIRQVENMVIKKLKGIDALRASLDEVGKHMASILSEHGHVMEENHFLDKVLGNYHSKGTLEKNAIFFLAKFLLNDYVSQIEEKKHVRSGWRTINAPWELFEGVIAEAKKFLSERKDPVHLNDLLHHITHTPFYKKNEHRLAEEHILSYLKLSQELHHNAFSEWGMADWTTVRPRRMSDKIYLVLKRAKKPLHFQEITDKINEAGFAGKKAYRATVHNELILDDRFILVGRGLYALSEWGYKPGVVADIIEDVLKANGGPMTKDDIISEVLKQRFVKPATINLSLMNKKRFKKIAPKTYALLN